MKNLIRSLRVAILHLLYRCSRSLPLAENSVIIAPHPDDEVIGCGGLMQTLVQTAKQVEVIIMSKGVAVHRHCCPNEEDSIVQAPERIHHLDFPDGDFVSAIDNDTLIRALENLVGAIAPTAVFIPHPYENSPDHVAATQIVKNILQRHSVKIFYYCVWTWYHMPLYKILK